MSTRATVVFLTAIMTTSVFGQPPSYFAITAGQVARVLSEGGTVTNAQQVTLPTRVVAEEPAPALDILSIQLLPKGHPEEHGSGYSRVELACRRHAQCLPFYALVNWPKPAGRTASTSLAVNPADITMRAGAHATLVMDDHRSHIQVAVISLENGMIGHRIRVASPDHKQFYFGEVVSANLLRGSF